MEQKLAKVKDVKEGKRLIVRSKDGTEIVLVCLNGAIYAFDNMCPHMQGPLGEGDIKGQCITCPWHGWEFDIVSGNCTNVEGEELHKYPIRIENGVIYLIEE